MERKRILLGITGSVAVVKLLDVLIALEHKAKDSGFLLEVKIVATTNALTFITNDVKEALRERFVRSMQNTYKSDLTADESSMATFFGEHIRDISREGSDTPPTPHILLTGFYTDPDEFALWKNEGKVLHIMLKSWADVFLIAPLDANSLAKIANGLADNLLSCVARAWPVNRKILIIAPAMNTDMWEHPLTAKHIDVVYDTLKAFLIDPIRKVLVCGDEGIGAMAHPDVIANDTIDIIRDSKWF